MKKLPITSLLLSFFICFFSNIFISQATNDFSTKENITEKSDIQRMGIIPAADPKAPNETQNRFATKVADGTLELNDLPFVIIYWIDWLTSLAASVAVVFLVYGGYQYLFSGVTDDKEDGKKTFLYAISGLIVVFFAWRAVNFAQTWITLKLEIS